MHLDGLTDVDPVGRDADDVGEHLRAFFEFDDPATAGSELRARIGIVLQSSAVYPQLSVVEILKLFAGYYTSPRDIEQVLALVGLSDRRNARVRTLSGGQKRRIDLGLALVGNPELIFMDEPTTGFDPEARHQAWDTIRGLRDLGATILLTTHYLEEAHQLSDRLAILHEGVIAAMGTPEGLLAASGAVKITYQRDGELVVMRTDEPTRVLHELTTQALADGVELEGLEVRRPSLEELFLDVVGADE